MSKLACKCGHVISDTTDFLSYKGHVISDMKEPFYTEGLTFEVNKLIDSVLKGDLNDWIREKWTWGGAQPSPIELFEGIAMTMFNNSSSEFYECINCGRLWFKPRAGHDFKCYSPDSGKYESLLFDPSVEHYGRKNQD